MFVLQKADEILVSLFHEALNFDFTMSNECLGCKLLVSYKKHQKPQNAGEVLEHIYATSRRPQVEILRNGSPEVSIRSIHSIGPWGLQYVM